MSKTKSTAKTATKSSKNTKAAKTEHVAAAPLSPVSQHVLDCEKQISNWSASAFKRFASEHGYHEFEKGNAANLRVLARCLAEEQEDVEATVAARGDAPVDFAAMKAEQAAIDADAADDKFLDVADQLNADASLDRSTPVDPLITAQTDDERESAVPDEATEGDVEDHEPKGPTIRERLRETIATCVAEQSSSATVDMIADAVTAAITQRFGFMVRKPREPKTTDRANALKLPDIGVSVTIRRKAAFHKVSIVERDGRRLVEYNGQTFDSLKAAATALCGYPPSIGGWQFFFGRLDMAEVNRKYAAEHSCELPPQA